MAVLRLVLAGLILTLVLPLVALTKDSDSLVQLGVVVGMMFAVSFALPHYFYRGEPLLPDRKRRRSHRAGGSNGAAT